MVLSLAGSSKEICRVIRQIRPTRRLAGTTDNFIDPLRLRGNATAGVSVSLITAMLRVSAANGAPAQTISALEPQAVSKPVTAQRLAWLNGRCSQLVAYYDYYGVGRGENSEGARNHTRLGAVIECAETDYRTGINTMTALLKRKAFVVPPPARPAIEPEDDGAPVIDPMRRSAF